MHRAVIHHRDAERRADSFAIGCSGRRSPVPRVEELVLRIAHDGIVGRGTHQVVQVQIRIQAEVSIVKASKIQRQGPGETRAGVVAVLLEQIVQVA